MKENAGKSGFLPDGSELAERIDRFLEEYGKHPHLHYARQALATLMKMLDEKADRLDWKIVTATIKEMRHSFRVLERYKDRRKVTVFGSARVNPDSEAFQAAEQFARRISAAGFMVITGAGQGIMLAANQGAGTGESFGLNINLPWEQSANRVVEGDEKLINYKYFFTRKLTFIRESHALALFPGGFGTLDETFELLTLIQCGKSPVLPIVMIDVPGLNYWTKWLRFMQTSQLKNGFISKDDLYLWSITYDVDEACRIITDFYRNYHSQRWVRDRLVLRLNRKLTGSELKELNTDFGDILLRGEIEQREALPEEWDDDGEVEFPELERLTFIFDRRSFGLLRRMIDRINQFD